MPKGDDDLALLEHQAMAAFDTGDHTASVVLHQRALEAAEPLQNPRLRAVILERLGAALEAAGDVQTAVVAFETGLSALDGTPGSDLEELLAALAARGKYYALTVEPGVPPDLETAASRADLRAAEADPALVVRLLVDIGNAYLEQSQDKLARLRYEAARARPEIANHPLLRAQALTGLGIIARRANDLDTAEATLAEAWKLVTEHGEPADGRRVRSAQAELHLRAGLARSEAAAREAVDLHGKKGDRRGEGRALVGLGRALLGGFRLAEARDAFTRALRAGEATGDPFTQIYANHGLGRAQRALGDLDGAAASLDACLSLLEAQQSELRTDEGQVTFGEQAAHIQDELITLHLIHARTAPERYRDALAVVERSRGRALSSLMGSRSRVPPPAGRVPEPMMLNFMQSAPGTFSGGAPAQGDGPSYWAPPLPRLVFHAMSDRTAVFAVTTNDEVIGHVADLGEAALADTITRLRAALGVSGAPRGTREIAPPVAVQPHDPDPLLTELFDTLIAPVLDALPAGDVPVIIEPHGPLWLLPFAALRLPDGSSLIDRFPLVQAPSLATMDEIRSEPPRAPPDGRRALVVGNPALVPLPVGEAQIELGPLPGAEEEARRIAAQFPAGACEVLIGEAADRDTVESAMRRVEILHLASHAVALASQPLDSFIALAPPPRADGRLTARRVLDTTLRAAPNDSTEPAHTDLVVLSACQTGLGLVAGDGVIGLTRAFLVVGARSVVVSLWSVDDDATAELMSAFYQEHLRGIDKAAALRTAMRRVREMPFFAAPRFWAPFVIVGAED